MLAGTFLQIQFGIEMRLHHVLVGDGLLVLGSAAVRY